jgi:hypothetical protein
MEFGSVQWAQARGGEVRGVEVLSVAWSLVRAQVAARLRRNSVPGLSSPRDVELAMREVELPESALVREALALVTTLGPEPLAQHALRTYAFGTLLGVRDGLAWDRECFAVAALLHDVALARRRHDFCCFAHDGADQATAFLATHAVPEPKRALVAEAICLHLRAEVPPSLGVEAHLVRAGSGLDVVGARAGELGKPLLRAVLERHPRGGLVAVLLKTFAEEQRLHSTSRISRWMKLGFGGLIQGNPLERVRP